MNTQEIRIAFQQAVTKKAQSNGKCILAIDFDDTLTVEGGIEALLQLRARGYGLVVFTANADFEGIQAWLQERWPADDEIPVVTDIKPQACAFIDDKAYRFDNWQ